MKPIFVDTSGWLAIVNTADDHHQEAVRIYQDLLQRNRRFVLHDGILIELGNSLSSIRARQTAIKLKENIQSSARIELVSLTPEISDLGWTLYSERLDKDWGIVDCISFIVMERFEIREALTADKHFEQAGFVKLL
jgi:uncharacterized protein